MSGSIQQTVGYHAGFYDAQDGDPLFDGAAPEYRAGWLAFHDCLGIVRALAPRLPDPPTPDARPPHP